MEKIDFDSMMESLDRLINSRHAEGACFPDVMPVDFERLKEIRNFIAGIQLLRRVLLP